jgi:hypothetical protein
VDFLGGDETDGTRLNFGNAAFDLPIPGSLSIGVYLLLQGLDEFFGKASAILG